MPQLPTTGKILSPKNSVWNIGPFLIDRLADFEYTYQDNGEMVTPCNQIIPIAKTDGTKEFKVTLTLYTKSAMDANLLLRQPQLISCRFDTGDILEFQTLGSKSGGFNNTNNSPMTNKIEFFTKEITLNGQPIGI
jgi:hypothetical protein